MFAYWWLRSPFWIALIANIDTVSRQPPPGTQARWHHILRFISAFCVFARIDSCDVEMVFCLFHFAWIHIYRWSPIRNNNLYNMCHHLLQMDIPPENIMNLKSKQTPYVLPGVWRVVNIFPTNYPQSTNSTYIFIYQRVFQNHIQTNRFYKTKYFWQNNIAYV